jgi:predicted ATPase/transcriptional regulator with XRE-family HTH domain/tetratricopeptide (TPR) repeat protein
MRGDEAAPSSSAFGTLLRQHRLAVGLSQEELAARAQMSTQGIGALERGDRRTPQRVTLSLLVQALGLEAEQRRAFEAAAERPKGLRPGDGRAATLSRAVENSAPHNLPRQVTSLIGRETVVDEVAALIEKSSLVTLVGPGGVGKTRIALEVAATVREGFADGVWLIELAPLSSGEYLPSAVTQVLGISRSDARDPLELLVSSLRARNALLIFDNCEHLVRETSRAVSAILRGCPRIRVLATSRQSLGASGETTFQIPSLTTPDPVTSLAAGEAKRFPAIELFCERAAAVDDRFALRDDNALAVAEVCRRLDGIPLAIELAAARTPLLSPQQLRDRLDERFALLTRGGRDLLPRQQTLRATLDWSYELLGENERVLARRLSVFANAFTIDGAVAAASGENAGEDHVLETLASLVDKSLVLAADSGAVRRYRLLESTKAYLREKLEAAGELHEARRQHLRYLRNEFTRARAQAERTGRAVELNALVVADLDEVRLALAHVDRSSEIQMSAELLVAIGDRMDRLGLTAEALVLFARFIKLLPAAESALKAALWTAIARTARTDRVRALEAIATALLLARNAADDELLADALVVYASSLIHQYNFDEASAVLREAERLAAPESVWPQLRILFTKASIGVAAGDLDAAAEAYERLREANQQLGNTTQANGIAVTLAELQYQRGKTAAAIRLAYEILDALRADRDLQSLAGALANLCGYLVAFGRLSEAAEIALEAFESSPEHDRGGIFVTDAVEHTALILALSNDLEAAARLAGYSEAAFQRLGYQREYTERVTRTRLDSLLSEELPAHQRDSLLSAGAWLTPERAVALSIANLTAILSHSEE